MGVGDSVHGGGSSEGNNNAKSIGLGKVIKNWDPKHPGMVKVSIMVEAGEKVDSDWMPVLSPYAANKCGLFLLPEVGSTVVIGYIDDNSVSPVVIGSLWLKNGEASTELPANTANKDNSIKMFSTSKGQLIRIEESNDKQEIEIITSKKQRVLLDDKNEKIEISSGGSETKIVIDGKQGEMNITAKKKVVITAGKSTVTMQDSGVSVKADKFSYDGNALELAGKKTKLDGSTVDINSSGNLNIKSSGMAQIKGSMLKLN